MRNYWKEMQYNLGVFHGGINSTNVVEPKNDIPRWNSETHTPKGVVLGLSWSHILVSVEDISLEEHEHRVGLCGRMSRSFAPRLRPQFAFTLRVRLVTRQGLPARPKNLPIVKPVLYHCTLPPSKKYTKPISKTFSFSIRTQRPYSVT